MQDNQIVLEVPRCECGNTLLARQFFKITDTGLVRYRNGESIDHGNFHEVRICGRCDR